MMFNGQACLPSKQIVGVRIPVGALSLSRVWAVAHAVPAKGRARVVPPRNNYRNTLPV